jgi:hypothetical protein
MTGGFALGEVEPTRGEHTGRRAATRLELETQVTIDDVDRFVRDPQHRGVLEGRIRFTPLGPDVVVDGGSVHLFPHRASHEPRVMAYTLNLRAGVREFHLAGYKHLGGRSVLHGWRETTTLFCRLHEGPDAGGAVAGAGILRITAVGFAKQLTSFRTLGATSFGDHLRARWTFIRFFAGELWDTYL